jgi:hypothetical protein
MLLALPELQFSTIQEAYQPLAFKADKLRRKVRRLTGCMEKDLAHLTLAQLQSMHLDCVRVHEEKLKLQKVADEDSCKKQEEVARVLGQSLDHFYGQSEEQLKLALRQKLVSLLPRLNGTARLENMDRQELIRMIQYNK